MARRRASPPPTCCTSRWKQLMQHKALIAPVLTYLFHRLEARFDGRPTLLILDEAWTFLDDALFAARIREWLKTLRKKNVAVAVRHPVAGRHRALDHRLGADRELPDPHLPAQRSRARAAGAQCLRALRPQRAADRDPEHGHAQARLLRPDRARQPAVRARARAGRPGAVRGLLARRPAAHRSLPRRRRPVSGFAARFLEAKGLAGRPS